MKIFFTFGERARVFWSKDIEEVLRFTAEGASITGDVIALEVADDIFAKLGSPFNEISNPQTIAPMSYWEKAWAALNPMPEWREKEGLRTFIIITKDNSAFWCPSGNELNRQYSLSPDQYLTAPIRVELNKEQSAWLDAYFEWECDSY